MSQSSTSGVVLTGDIEKDITLMDEVAVRIAEMWIRYNESRRNALLMNEEARRFIFATDMDATSARNQPHVNRTHMPKLTEISDALQSEYFDASLSMPDFFRYRVTPQPSDSSSSEVPDFDVAKKIELWVRSKLEQRKFRQKVGRQLLADYVNFGNCLARVEYVREHDSDGRLLYQGPDIKRISPLDIVFNPQASGFEKTPKVLRTLMHVSEMNSLPQDFPEANFRVEAINKAVGLRGNAMLDDWVETIKSRGLAMDGFGGWDEYFKQDLVEVLIYVGDVYNPNNNSTERNRIVYVVDRSIVIRNEPNNAPSGFDGFHHAGWRIRTDNLWAQGPLDNLVGLQYRIDHLENLRADVFDYIAHPTVIIVGDNVSEPEEGFTPGAVYYAGTESDVKVLSPDATALQADNQIELYTRRMDNFAGVPPQSQGQRTPGEKTAFEVQTLEGNATKKFVDKARNFELMLEGLLREIFELMLIHYDGGDYIEIFDDIAGEQQIRELSAEEVASRGEFVAIGARHWERRQRETVELNNFVAGPGQSPLVAPHISGVALARLFERKLQFEDADIVEPYIGIKEGVNAQAIAASELQQFQENAGQEGAPDPFGNAESVDEGQEQDQ